MQLTYKDVRFEVQIYTDKGPTNRLKNRYNSKDLSSENSSYLFHPRNHKNFLRRNSIDLGDHTINY